MTGEGTNSESGTRLATTCGRRNGVTPDFLTTGISAGRETWDLTVDGYEEEGREDTGLADLSVCTGPEVP